MIAVLSFGTVGYLIIEGWSFLDSLYMAAITLTTVGFGEIHPLTINGRIFTVALIFLGVGTIAFGVSTLGETLVSADLGPSMRKRRSKRMISKMKNHVVVCGYGRVGHSAVKSLMEIRHDVVIIDKVAAVYVTRAASIHQTDIPDPA